MDNAFVQAGIAMLGGLIFGAVGSAIVKRVMDKDGRPDALRQVAAPVAGFVFSLGIIIGLVSALGVINPASLEQMPKDFVAYLPKALTAAIIVIAANVIGTLLASGLDATLEASGKPASRLPGLIKTGIMVVAGIIAAGQAGIDTTIIHLAAGALFFGLSGAFALMVGLGSRRVSSEIAAGRAFRSIVSQGDQVDIDGVSGEIVGIHTVSVAIKTLAGSVVYVPNSRLLEGSFSVDRT